MNKPCGYLNRLTSNAMKASKLLSYSDATAEAKYALVELCNAVDSMNTYVSEDGRYVRNAHGSERKMSLKERFLYMLFNVVPRCV